MSPLGLEFTDLHPLGLGLRQAESIKSGAWGPPSLIDLVDLIGLFGLNRPPGLAIKPIEPIKSPRA